jgi:MraZ protein
MFMGTYAYALDPKGRLFIPAKLRGKNERTIQQYVITQGLEECLYLYERKVFVGLSGKLAELPVQNQSDARAFRRLFLAGAGEATLDPMGRLLLPKGLIRYARIRREVSIVGAGERIELWAQERWARYVRQTRTTFHRMGSQLNI